MSFLRLPHLGQRLRGAYYAFFNLCPACGGNSTEVCNCCGNWQKLHRGQEPSELQTACWIKRFRMGYGNPLDTETRWWRRRPRIGSPPKGSAG